MYKKVVGTIIESVICMEVYIIDNLIVFVPEEKIIESLKTGTKLPIQSAGARCLKLLLERQGEVVPQTELMIAGWGKDALSTLSIPAYYQCFVNLRKALKRLGYEKELFATRRGRGLRINTYINVKKSNNDNKIAVTTDNPLDTDSQELLPHQNDKRLLTPERDDYLALPEQSGADTETAMLETDAGKKQWKFIVIFAGIVVLSVCLWFFLQYQKPLRLSGYVRVADTPSCFYFNVKNKDNVFAVDYLVKKRYRCTTDEKYFISYFSASPRLTVFICGKANPLNCDSVTYVLAQKK